MVFGNGVKNIQAAAYNGAHMVCISDGSEPSWLEPELELKDFQLGSARDLFLFSSKTKIGRKRAEIFIFFKKILFS